MGIQGLLPLLKSIMLPIHIKDLEGSSVAIDTYSWLHKGAFCCSKELCNGLPTSKYLHSPFFLLDFSFPFSIGSKILYCLLYLHLFPISRIPSWWNCSGSFPISLIFDILIFFMLVVTISLYSIRSYRHVDYCMHRINLLRHYGVKPVLVFDGGLLPMKSEQEIKRAR